MREKLVKKLLENGCTNIISPTQMIIPPIHNFMSNVEK